MSKFYDVAYTIRDAYENQCLVSVDALLKLLNDCEEIQHSASYKIRHSISHHGNGPAYSIKFEVKVPLESRMYKLWFYFYDEDNVLIIEFYGLDDNKYDVNYDNCDDIQIDFEPITVNRLFL